MMLEGRKQPRSPKRLLAQLSAVYDPRVSELATVENDSPNGTRVTTVRSWELGSHVELTRPNGEKWARARVVYCKPLDEKRFAVGLNLLMLADDSSPKK